MMKHNLSGLLAVLITAVSPAYALDVQATKIPGRAPPSLSDGEIATNRADGRLFYKSETGAIVGGLLPDLDANGYLKFRNGMTLGRYQDGKFISQPDAVQTPSVTITGSGSTGLIPGMSVPSLGAVVPAAHGLGSSLASIPTDGRELFPTVASCPAGNCYPAQPSVAVLWMEGKTRLGNQAEALVNLGWTVTTGAGNAQKPAFYVGAAQATGGGSTWAFNPLVVRGCVPGASNATPGHTGSCGVTQTPGSIGVLNSTINTEFDFVNWDQDGLLGSGPFTVGLYIHNASVYASSASIYVDSDPLNPGRNNYAWHVGLGFYNTYTVKDSTIYDGTNSAVTINVEGTHTAAMTTAAATLQYATIHKAGQATCWNTLAGCLRWDSAASGLVYANSNTGSAIFTLANNGTGTAANWTATNNLTANSNLYVLGNGFFSNAVNTLALVATGAVQGATVASTGLMTAGTGLLVSPSTAGAAGTPNKIALFGNLTSGYGFGVSNASQDYVVPSNAAHTFYAGSTGLLSVSTNGVSLPAGAFKTAEYTVAGLFGCGAGSKGSYARVSDASGTITYRGTLTGGGTISAPVYCNGTSWEYH